MKTEQKTIESREENEFICLQLNGSTSDNGLAAGLADGLVVGRVCVWGGHLTVNQCRVSINLPLRANFRRPSGKFSMLGSLSGAHGTQPGVPYHAAVYNQRGMEKTENTRNTAENYRKTK